MTNSSPLVAQVVIKLEGAPLAAARASLLIDMAVEDDLDQPAMCVLRFQDQNYQLTDGNDFKLGTAIELRAANRRGQTGTIFIGEVTALETEQEQSRTTFLVRAYDRSHRLHRGRKTRTFLKQSDDAIVARIAREAGLQSDVISTGVTHEYLIQDNQTDFAFLHARAARLGYRIVVDDKTLRFRPAESGPPQAPDQVWGENLIAVRSRQTAVAQPSEVQVRGWDPHVKQAIVGRATTSAQESSAGDGVAPAGVARSAFGSRATVTITDQPVASQGEADKLAQSVLDQLAADYLFLEASCIGEPKLRAGSKVNLSGAGKRTSGSYLITSTRHELTPEGGYTTTIYVNGRRPNSLLALTGESRQQRTVEGVVAAIVTNINDPEKLGRVKLKFPWLDDQQESTWARIATPGGGKDRGFFALPEVTDEVLVAFEHGDINRPYVVGGLWNRKDKPPAEVVRANKVGNRVLKTRVGHVIELQDEAGGGNGFITLKTKDGHEITISDSDKSITIVTSGGNKVAISDTARSISLSSKGKIELESPGGKLVIAENGVELSSQSMLKVQANAMLDVKTSAILNLQGSLVKIN